MTAKGKRFESVQNPEVATKAQLQTLTKRTSRTAPEGSKNDGMSTRELVLSHKPSSTGKGAKTFRKTVMESIPAHRLKENLQALRDGSALNVPGSITIFLPKAQPFRAYRHSRTSISVSPATFATYFTDLASPSAEDNIGGEVLGLSRKVPAHSAYSPALTQHLQRVCHDVGAEADAKGQGTVPPAAARILAPVTPTMTSLLHHPPRNAASSLLPSVPTLGTSAFVPVSCHPPPEELVWFMCSLLEEAESALRPRLQHKPLLHAAP
ncbi:hypothetical protein H920_11957 [Fukomys damarensis]|uniref:Uncharacterized protein n=1 Tax=Fukomys damarensis TaxID=885580 RepID=A0A091D7U1_FUKDA|nr:hypothetical protein H920_11957 [Fukomys damarensis]